MAPILDTVHPGEGLLERILAPMSIRLTGLAGDLGVPPRRVNEFIHGKPAVTADTTLRLAGYFGRSRQTTS